MAFESEKTMFEIYREREFNKKFKVVYYTELTEHNKEAEINHALNGETIFDGFIKDISKSLLNSLSDFEYLNEPVIWKDTLKCRSQDPQIRQIYLEDLRSWLNSGEIPNSDIENAIKTLINEMSTPVSDSQAGHH